MKEIYPALKAIVMKDGKMLIIKRSSKEDHFKDQWDIPGGKFDFGETPLECLKRELLEEANIQIYDDFKPVRIWTFFKNNGETQVVGITVLCKYKSGEVNLGSEHVDFKWIDPKEIDDYDVHEGIKKDIRTLIKFIE